MTVRAETTVTTSPASPCGCPPDTETVTGGVYVTGHTIHCTRGGEPRRYTWLNGGYLTVGTLADYAKTWEDRTHSGDREALGTELRTWDATYQVTTSSRPVSGDNDWLRVELRVGNERAIAAIDGRV